MSYLTEQSREVIWTSTKINSIGSNLNENARGIFEDLTSGKIIELYDKWVVNYTEERGLLPPRFLSKVFDERSDAEAFYNRFKDGNYVYFRFQAEPLTDEKIEKTRKLLDSGDWSEVWSENTEFGELVDTRLAKEVLVLSGIVDPDKSSSTTKVVLDYIGSKRRAELKKKFPLNWQYVIEFEYCMHLFSEDSPAYIAAAARYCEFVTNEPKVVGYLIRDLEILRRGAELAFSSDILRKDKSKLGTQEASSARLKGRLETLIISMNDKLKSEIEEKSKKRWTEATLSKFAAAELVRKDDPHWRVGGAGSVGNYIVSIRAGEAGEGLQLALRDINKNLISYLKQTVVKNSGR